MFVETPHWTKSQIIENFQRVVTTHIVFDAHFSEVPPGGEVSLDELLNSVRMNPGFDVTLDQIRSYAVTYTETGGEIVDPIELCFRTEH